MALFIYTSSLRCQIERSPILLMRLARGSSHSVCPLRLHRGSLPPCWFV
jgi:hypothetical protein